MYLSGLIKVAALVGLLILVVQAQDVSSPRATVETGQQGIEQMIFIPAGEFTLGLSASDVMRLTEHFRVPGFWFRRERTAHQVWLPGFLIDRFEVTNRQYQKFILATGHPSPKDWSGSEYFPGKENHPVVNVNREDAEAFCKWAGKRLPAEQEWEKAARGGTSRNFPWGDEFTIGNANTVETGRWDTANVGSFRLDKSPYGVMDMAGNVSEWVADDSRPYLGFQASQGELYAKPIAIARGGNWRVSLLYARTTNRTPADHSRGNPAQGFRCAASR